LELNSSSAKSAIYLSNRAFAHIKMENYGLAIEDANEAIKLDPNYAKSYYRKADSYIALA
jgi:serine/threonine-protein phosphatase 5